MFGFPVGPHVHLWDKYFFGYFWPAGEEYFSEEVLKRVKDLVGLRFGLRGVGQNFRPSPMIVLRDLGTWVVGSVRSCMARLVGRVK